MSDVDCMYDLIYLWVMQNNDDPGVAKAVIDMDCISVLTCLEVLARNVVEAPDKNKLHRRIYATAVADRLEGK